MAVLYGWTSDLVYVTTEVSDTSMVIKSSRCDLDAGRRDPIKMTHFIKIILHNLLKVLNCISNDNCMYTYVHFSNWLHSFAPPGYKITPAKTFYI